jgi:hypothetical protein
MAFHYRSARGIKGYDAQCVSPPFRSSWLASAGAPGSSAANALNLVLRSNLRTFAALRSGSKARFSGVRV